MEQRDEKLTFKGQRSGEEVVVVLHQHPWFFFRPGVKIIGLAILVILVVKFAGFSTLFTIVFFASLPVAAYIIGHNWFSWINTTYVLTSERIIAVEQKNWFARSVTEAPLANIMTVTHDINGPVKSLLNFGNVMIRASGASENEIVLRDVLDPFEIQQKILDTAKG